MSINRNITCAQVTKLIEDHERNNPRGNDTNYYRQLLITKQKVCRLGGRNVLRPPPLFNLPLAMKKRRSSGGKKRKSKSPAKKRKSKSPAKKRKSASKRKSAKSRSPTKRRSTRKLAFSFF
jgi:hypothetical protein